MKLYEKNDLMMPFGVGKVPKRVYLSEIVYNIINKYSKKRNWRFCFC